MAGNVVQKALSIGAVSYIVIVALVFFAEGGLKVREKTVEVHASPTERKLLIPKIGVDAKIQTVGTMPNGSIGIPSNAQDVAWFAGSAPIGRSAGTAAAGTAVVVGHVDTRVFGPGVFRNLKGLTKGDDIYTSIDGRIRHFRVTGHTVYPEGTDRMEEVVGTREGKARLVLITCDGKWDQSVKRYTERLVVFADLVS
ncbi:MAG: class F sortase [bacterium]|nr:class F sortase [bacterium]